MGAATSPKCEYFSGDRPLPANSFETMERRSKPRSGSLEFVVNIAVCVSFVTVSVSTQGVNHELYRHRPPQADYQRVRQEPRAQGPQTTIAQLRRTRQDRCLFPRMGRVSGGRRGDGQLRVAVA